MGGSLTTWSTYRASIGDRSALFAAIAEHWPVERALYAGSYVDLSPSTAIRDVTYVDTDARARRFFGADDVVADELAGRTTYDEQPVVRFLAMDYGEPLPVDDESMDLVISLYSGLAWRHTSRYLRAGGLLLANNSHGDASMAALDHTLTLEAAVISRDETYRLSTTGLDTWLVPKRPESLTVEAVERTGRGAAFTRSCFAYVFRCAPRERLRSVGAWL